MIYYDLSDVVFFAQHSEVVSGLQRVILNLARELQQQRDDIVFITRGVGSDCWYRLDKLEIAGNGDIRLFNRFNDNWQLGRIKWSYTRDRFRNRRGRHKFKPIFRFLASRLFRPLIPFTTLNITGVQVQRWHPHTLQDDDVLFFPSILQNNKIYRRLLEQVSSRVKIIFFLHDIIPLVAKEFCTDGECQNFSAYFSLLVEKASLVLTSAQSNVDDFVRYSHQKYPGIHLPPIEAVGLPVDFPTKVTDENFFAVSPVLRRLLHYRFCLCVGSVGPRKNHFELLQAWKKFYDSPAYNNEILVVAGALWESCPDIGELLRSHFCGGSVIFAESPSDVELAFLYEHCRFTVCLSLYEGWGLPVSESIALGKPVLALKATSLPEAGYGLATIIPSRKLSVVQQEITRMFGDEDYYQAAVQKIRDHAQKLPNWGDFAQLVWQSIEKLQAKQP